MRDDRLWKINIKTDVDYRHITHNFNDAMLILNSTQYYVGYQNGGFPPLKLLYPIVKMTLGINVSKHYQFETWTYGLFLLEIITSILTFIQVHTILIRKKIVDATLIKWAITLKYIRLSTNRKYLFEISLFVDCMLRNPLNFMIKRPNVDPENGQTAQ